MVINSININKMNNNALTGHLYPNYNTLWLAIFIHVDQTGYYYDIQKIFLYNLTFPKWYLGTWG